MNKKYLAISIGVGLVIVGVSLWVNKPKSESVVGASVFQVQQGGTGLSSYHKGDLIYGSATNVLAPLASGSTGQVLKIAGGIPSWGTDNAGGSSFTGLLMGEGATAKTHIDSLTYSPSSFNFSPTASAGLLTLDYTNGPASRSMSQTWTGTPYFSVGASMSAGEFTSYASASNYYGANLATCGSQDALQWSGGKFSCSSDFALSTADLTALGALDATAGYLVQTGAATFARRTLTGTSNQIAVTNGDGTVGNPVFSIPSLLSITTASLSSNFEVTGYASISKAYFGGNKQIQFNSSIASISIPLEVTGAYASATAYFGATLTNCTGTNFLQWSSTTGKFTCAAAPAAGSLSSQAGMVAGQIMFLQSASVASGSSAFSWNTTTKVLTMNGELTGSLTTASHSLAGTIEGPSDNTLSLGTFLKALLKVIAYTGKFITSLIIPNSANPSLTTAGQIAVNTASNSLNLYGTANRVLDPKKCIAVSLAGADLTAKKQFTIFTAEDAYTISTVQMTASGSNALGWSLLTGSATVPVTNVFSANHSASGSGVTKYSTFSSANVSDGQKLDIVVSSTSATLNSVYVRTCLFKNP